MPAIVQPVRRPPTAPAMNGQMDFKAALSIPAQSISSFMLLFPFLVLVMVCVRFALCHLPVGRVGRVRRVGHLIFKKEMPESSALGRCLTMPLAVFRARSTLSKRAELVMDERCCTGHPKGGTAFRRLRPLTAQAITSLPYTGR